MGRFEVMLVTEWDYERPIGGNHSKQAYMWDLVYDIKLPTLKNESTKSTE
jgi:hypothetical protein